MLNEAKETSVFSLHHLASFSMSLPAALHTDTPLPGDTESVKIKYTLHVTQHFSYCWLAPLQDKQHYHYYLVVLELSKFLHIIYIATEMPDTNHRFFLS